MMNRLFHILIIVLSACAQEKESPGQPVISIDFDITRESGLKPDDIECIFIPLEATDESLLSLSFEDVQFSDGRIYIVNFSNNMGRVLVFNREGKFITQISRIGVGAGEYMQPYKLHIDKNKNMITVADRHLNKLISYDLDSYKYISNKSIPFNFNDCVWLSDEDILWINEGGIDLGKRKWYFAGITNREMEITATYHETTPSGYIIGSTSVYKYADQTYTGLPFSPYIFRIDTANMTPVMKLSFGGQHLPPRSLVVDEKENSMAWQSRVLHSDYIIACHAHETASHLGVSFYGKSFKHHLGFYDKRNKTAHAFTGEDFMKSFHLYGVYEIITTYDDYFVARAEPRLLKKYPQEREDLRRIAGRMTEEDNPVLCLFKFN